ncbi:PREDICTED: uncharacterized protein LOC105112273 [Populus euphratica]|uniref:Uncharacterized protein LOC105112273 n=1 Tax=Populus euphratica TaxID=75702 RepID=A0AAJ6T8K0_POPEU|nr:PREDICTED: uncharacterized protein LOC105112273 [Populus euphratica]
MNYARLLVHFNTFIYANNTWNRGATKLEKICPVCLFLYFGSFVAHNKPGDGKRFLRALGKEKQDLAERVMVTRLHLYGKWIKKCDHAEIYKEISDDNLELMRERLKETVIWPSDDTNTEKIG